LFFGDLIVKVSLSEDAIPIKGAAVYVKKNNITPDPDHFGEFLRNSEVSESEYDEKFVTDENGETKPISVETPNPALANDENNTQIPYSVCDVYIIANGFVPTRIRGVQMFGGQRSILPVKLTVATQSDHRVIIINIPPHNLLLSVERNHEWESAVPILPKIDQAVYLPKKISVHMGEPSVDAPVLYVDFIDYIKNVASCEAYPTWPENALYSNLLAMISLALNRVYTEWYYCQGYHFQITNSVCYDQGYVAGRNVFFEINSIVEDIFDTYIRKVGNIEPLFAVYCDGKNISCNGLEQWGAVALAEENMSPIQILQNYYSDEIELVIADTVQNPDAYPGEPLCFGSMDESVRKLQGKLNRIRENYPKIPHIAVETGKFDADTDAAVRKFQELFYLCADGTCGADTWRRISDIYEAVTALSEFTREGMAPNFPAEPPNTLLQTGSRGAEVMLLQFLLGDVGLFYQAVPSIEIDGFFGPATKTALISFQKTFGMEPTGIVTVETWETLFRIFDRILETVVPLLAVSQFPGYELSVGSVGEGVSLMQSYLNILSNYYPTVMKMGVTGVFDESTKDAVTELQTIFGIKPAGTINFETWTKILELYQSNENGMKMAEEPSVKSNYPGTPVRFGSRGEAVNTVQKIVNEINKKHSGDRRIPEDGYYGNSTRIAIAIYQKRKGLEQTGFVDQTTWNCLQEDQNKEKKT